jgi:hypothetical protein
MALDEPATREETSLGALRASARGWQGIQVAVLGFIGLCGVLTDAGPSTPRAIQVLAGLLALLALALACVGTFLVGRTAWPLYRGAAAGGEGAGELRRAGRALSAGLVLTFAAVALTALSAASGWWPSEESGGAAVEARAGGQTWCGTLAEAQPGDVRLRLDAREVDIPLGALSALRPVDGCQ